MAGLASGLPQILGHYRIAELIGAGGMGEVYRAWDEHLSDRDVAIKVLPAGTLADETARKQFRREAVALSKLNHPNIATVLDFDTQNGIDYLVLEYVAGVTLSTRLSTGPLSIPKVVDLALQLAEGLVAAHEHGVIHCDLKPANLRITPDGRLKILDFGLARLAHRADGSLKTESLTEAQALAGTLAYMDPEQLQGRVTGEQTDIYGFGAVLYEMVTGAWPYREVLSPRLISAILNDPPIPPSVLNPDVPEALEKIINRCLAKQSSERFESMRDALQEMRQLQQSDAPPVSKLRRFARRNRRRIKIAMRISVAFLVGLIALTSYHGLSKRPAASAGNQPAARVSVLIADIENGGTEPIPDRALREGLSINIQQSKFVNVYPRDRARDSLERMKQGGLSRITEELGREICKRENVNVLLAGSATRMGRNLQLSVKGINPYSGAVLFVENRTFSDEETMSKLDALANGVRRQLGESVSGIQVSSRPLASVSTSSINALQLYSEALDKFKTNKNQEVPALLNASIKLDPKFAMAYRLLGVYYSFGVGNNPRSLEALARAYALRETVTEREQLSIEAAYFNAREMYSKEQESLLALLAGYPDDIEAGFYLAKAYFNLHDYKRAASMFSEIIDRDPNFGEAYPMEMLALLSDQQPQQAMRVYEEAANRGMKTDRLTWNYGLALMANGDVAAARKQFEVLAKSDSEEFRERGGIFLAVADLYEGKLASATRALKLVPKDGYLIQTAKDLLARTALLQGQKADAIRYADALISTGNPQIVSYRNAGIIYAMAGRVSSAHAVLAILDARRKEYSARWRESCYLNLRGEIQLQQGDLESAISSFESARQIDPTDPVTRFGLARAYQKNNDRQKAAEEWEQVLRRRAAIFQNGFPPDIVLAHMELGRLYVALNVIPSARTHYGEVLNLWKDGDEHWIRKQAKQELENLGPL